MISEDYQALLESKIKIAESRGVMPRKLDLHPTDFPHQQDVIKWALEQGRALIAAQFGLGKTTISIELARLLHQETGAPFLVVCPLGVKHQFVEEDGPRLGVRWQYVRTDAEVEAADTPYLITNYERCRDGQIDPRKHDLCGVSLDEGAVLRSLGSKTYQVFLDIFSHVPYRFVCTATPSPNRFRELIYYAKWLGVMDTGESLTRWFKRNPDKAGDLTIMPQYEHEFWLWVASWAIFLQRPSDLGYDDTGYDLPPMRIHWHRLGVDHSRGWTQADQDGQLNLLLNASASVSAEATERRETMPDRIAKMLEIVGANKRKHWLIWHHLEDERRAIEKAIPSAVTVFGSQELEEREDSIIGFSRGKVRILATKPSLAGSGCNFQRHCYSNIFLGVDYKFADFIQAIHRTHRFQQPKPVDVHIIYAESQDRIVETLKQKWRQHEELMLKMSGIMKEYGLSHAALKKELGRKMGVTRIEVAGEHFTAVHNDCVPEMKRLADNSIDLIHTSVPFGNHYEYSIQIEDFGHNPSDGDFFVQMDYLIPDLLRVLKPGRVAAVHVKDRVLYGHQTPSGFMEIGEFSDDAVKAFKKHGFLYEGRRTIVTDVVRENNSSYRLGWSEMCKDASKMGSGLPEYLLLFRKPPTGSSQQYADEPVTKNKKDYTRGRWQVDAHAIWRASGDRLLTPDELATFEPGAVSAMYTAEQMNSFFYDHARHVAVCEAIDKEGRLPSAFMLLPPKITKSDEQAVWDDVNFLNNLNSDQMRRGEANHLCPLAIDVVERAIRLYSNPGDLVLDPFAGLFTVPYVAIKLGRRAYGIELADTYFKNGVGYCQAIEREVSMPTLFDLLQKCEAVVVEER